MGSHANFGRTRPTATCTLRLTPPHVRSAVLYPIYVAYSQPMHKPAGRAAYLHPES